MLDESAWDAAAAIHGAALDALEQGKLDDAERLAREAIAALDRAVGADHPDAANARCTLGQVALARARYDDAAALAREADAPLAAITDEPVVDGIRVGVLELLGEACVRLGAYDEAGAALDAALDVARRIEEGDPARAAGVQCARGVRLKLLGRLDEAQAAYDDARRRYAAAGLDVPAGLLHNCAGLACARGDYATAEALAREAIALRLAEQGEVLALALDEAGLADALAGQGRAEEAEATYASALERMRDVAPEHPEVGYALHNLADLLADSGREHHAEARYREAIAHKARALGAEHHETAASEANLAALLAVRQPEEARDLARRAAASSASLPEGHPVRTGCAALAERIGGAEGAEKAR